ncbi:DivIVA domain-containing protein [Uniformispora flossi]|uniref:DivIVA domain-containing protein n=1 Tax=Uniformispora flossi TaxID=3390723 RepID=UPI003C2DA01F
MFWIQLVVVTAVVFVVAAVVLGAGGSLPDAYQDRPDLSWTPDKPLTVEDVDRVRFPVVLRGYRMSEVDYTLDRLSAELSARDARIMDLEYRLAGVVPAGVAGAAVAVGAAVGAAGYAGTAPVGLEKQAPEAAGRPEAADEIGVDAAETVGAAEAVEAVAASEGAGTPGGAAEPQAAPEDPSAEAQDAAPQAAAAPKDEEQA